VYSAVGRSEAAIYHAQRCLTICRENGIGDFDLAFAYEGLARGYAVGGDPGKSQEYIKLATQAGQEIEDEGNREYFLGELRTVNDLLA
jgi:hypothetical protein